MYNLFQVNQTLRSLRGLVTGTVTPNMRGYATHFAIAYAIVIIGWLLYSHRTTTTTNNYTTTIDEEVCQLRQGHIETTSNNNYITIKISTQNEHQNTSSNILTANNITSNTVIKSVEEALADMKSTVADVPSTVLDTSVNKCNNKSNNKQGIGYIKYWLGGLLMVMITAIPWDHSSVVIQQSVDVLIISLVIITVINMITFVYTLLKGIITNTFVVVLTGFLVVMALDWDSSITCQSSQALVFAVSIYIIISIVCKILPLTSTIVGCAARGIIQATTIIVFGLLVFCGWFASGVVTLLRIRIRELGAGFLLIMIFAIPWNHSSVVIQQLVKALIASLMIITAVKMIVLIYSLLKVASLAVDQVLEWVVAPLINNFFGTITNTLVVVLTASFFIEAKLQHTLTLTRVHHQLNPTDNAADDDAVDFGHVDEVPIEYDEQPILRNFRAKPLELSEDEIKEDVDLVQQAWNLQYDDAGLPLKKKKLQINENENHIQDIAGREEADVSIDFFESFRHLIPQLQQAAPAKFEKGSPLELLVRKCNAFHLLDDIFRLEEELHALEKQVKKEKRLEKKLQSDLVGWDVPQGRSRRIRKQRVIFMPRCLRSTKMKKN